MLHCFAMSFEYMHLLLIQSYTHCNIIVACLLLHLPGRSNCQPAAVCQPVDTGGVTTSVTHPTHNSTPSSMPALCPRLRERRVQPVNKQPLAPRLSYHAAVKTLDGTITSTRHSVHFATWEPVKAPSVTYRKACIWSAPHLPVQHLAQ